MEKLVYVLWGVVLAGIAAVIGILWLLYLFAYSRGVEDTRKEVAEAADVCRQVVNMGLKDWQNATGMDLTYQVQCEPLYNVAAGREFNDDGE